MGEGWEKLRFFVGVGEAYSSPWFTPLPEEIRHAIVLMSVPEPAEDEAEVLHEIRRRSPRAVLAWARLPPPPEDDRAVVQVFGGLGPEVDFWASKAQG